MNKTTLNSQKEKHSMLSLRRATFVGLAAHRLRNISIHALLAESDLGNVVAGLLMLNFYPRSPCGERLSVGFVINKTVKFLSTLSLRRATGTLSDTSDVTAISIHALLAESDYRQTSGSCKDRHFYPRSPCGERQKEN